MNHLIDDCISKKVSAIYPLHEYWKEIGNRRFKGCKKIF